MAHVPSELAGRDSDIETSSSFSDENRAAVVASSAIPSTELQPPQQSTTTTVAPVSSPATPWDAAGVQSPSIYTVMASKMLFLQELGSELGLCGLKCGRSVLGRCCCTMALRLVYLMSKVYLWVSGLKWVENLMTDVYPG